MIPACLKNAAEFRWLTERQSRSFEARLACCVEILEMLRALPDPTDRSFLDELDDIELNTYSVMSHGNPEESVSPYLVHSSWTQNCNREMMFQALPGGFGDFLVCSMPGLRSAPAQDRSWLRNWGDVLESVFRSLEHAETFDAAIANCIAIDTMMAIFLQYSAKKRLSF